MVNKEINIQILEEAAENYRRKSYNAAMIPSVDGPINEYGGSVKEAFKAGAEWMRNKDVEDMYMSDNNGHQEYIRKDALIKWLENKIKVPDVSFINGLTYLAYQDVIEHLNEM